MPQPKYLKIEQSSLYRLGRKKDLANLFGLGVDDLISLSHDENYNEWPKKQVGKKDRIIEEPNKKLAQVLKSLHYILQKIETPSWLLSGMRGIKPSDNAEFHKINRFMVNVDIEAFFQSTKREFVYRCFKDIFDQKGDVASLLADLATYKGHIPTGTSISQDMAFWAYKQLFERIQKLCQSKEILMSVWVDDITFSSLSRFPNTWVKDIEKMAKMVELNLKKSKTKKYGAKDFKCVTGSIISPFGNILIKNQKRKEIIGLMESRRVEELGIKDTRKLFGKLTAQRQNEADFFQGVYSRTKDHLRKMEKELAKKKSLLKKCSV